MSPQDALNLKANDPVWIATLGGVPITPSVTQATVMQLMGGARLGDPTIVKVNLTDGRILPAEQCFVTQQDAFDYLRGLVDHHMRQLNAALVTIESPPWTAPAPE
jgi:hypothetical protein